MDYSEFTNDLYAFLKNGSNIKHLDDLLSKSSRCFADALQKLDKSLFKGIVGINGKGQVKKDNVIANVNAKIQKSTEEIKDIINGTLYCGDTSLYRYLFNNNKSGLIQLVPSYMSFYRMRSSSDKGYDFYDSKDMFIIDYEKETLLGQYRFNRQGIPALYIAEHLYGCWEETRNPDLMKVNCCRIMNVSELRVLNLFIADNYTTVEQFLMAWLAMICCYNVANDSNRFKFEYAVPNIILDMLRYYNSKCTDDKKKVHGIKYLSSKYQYKEDLEFSDIKSLFYNYVFPSMEDLVSTSKGDDLKIMFKVSRGYSLTFYQIHSLGFVKYKAWTNSYKSSIFAAIEEQLKKEKVEFVKHPRASTYERV